MNIDSREALATSLLAEVVCTDLPANAIGTSETARSGLRAALLLSDSVDSVMGGEVARRYALLSAHEARGTGFYAAVFLDRATRQLYLAIRGRDIVKPPGLIDDATRAGTITREPVDQLGSLRHCVDEISAAQGAGTLPPGALTLTGYSLDGHLVHCALCEFAGLAASAYTFNGAGIGGFSGLSGGAQDLPCSASHFVQNFIAEPYLRHVSSRVSGLLPGTGFAIFVEGRSGRTVTDTAPGLTRSSNAIAQLVDALGVYRVLDLVAHGRQSFEQLTALLAATTRYSLETLESSLASIGRFFGIEADLQYLDPRARLHDLSFRLIGTLEGVAGTGAGLLNLLGLGVPELVRIAAADTPQGLAVRHALMHGLPFAVTGVDYNATVNADGRYDRERFSAEYLLARAEYAHLLFVADDTDTSLLPARVIAPNTSSRNPEMAAVPAAVTGYSGTSLMPACDPDGASGDTDDPIAGGAPDATRRDAVSRRRARTSGFSVPAAAGSAIPGVL